MVEKNRKYYPCAQCGGNLIRKKGGMCRECYLKNARGKRLERLAKKALKQRLNPPRETRKQREVKQAKRRRWAKAPKCDSVPRWAINTKLMTDGTRHEIGFCAYFQDGKCRNTKQPCPLNGVRDFTELQAKEGKVSRSIESIGLYPNHDRLPKSMTTPSKRDKSRDVDPPPSRDYYHAPVGRLMPLDSMGSMDDLFREIER